MRLGAALWVGCLQYFCAEAIAALCWSGSYSFRYNFISDLGAVHCRADLAKAHSGCSPLHALMNASFLLQGLLILVGTVLVWPLFPRGCFWALALGLVAASGIGVFIVGLAPEDVASGWHYFGAAENLLLCNLGTILLGIALLRETRRALTVGLLSLAAGFVGLFGVALLATRADFGLGQGIIERIAAYPFPLWIASVGAWLLRGGLRRALDQEPGSGALAPPVRREP